MERKFYKLVWVVARAVFDVFVPRKVHGIENLPAEGGFILCANHFSALDPFYISSRMPLNRWIMFMGKKELYDNKFLRPLVMWLGLIPVDRGNADLGAVRTSLKVLKEGACLCIFPQGTRSRGNVPTPMLGGASMIALRGGVPVIPVYIDGPYRLFRRSDIHFGAPLDFSDFGRRCDSDTLAQATARIEAGIWGLRKK